MVNRDDVAPMTMAAVQALLEAHEKSDCEHATRTWAVCEGCHRRLCVACWVRHIGRRASGERCVDEQKDERTVSERERDA